MEIIIAIILMLILVLFSSFWIGRVFLVVIGLCFIIPIFGFCWWGAYDLIREGNEKDSGSLIFGGIVLGAIPFLLLLFGLLVNWAIKLSRER